MTVIVIRWLAAFVVITASLAVGNDSLIRSFSGTGISNTRPFTAGEDWEIQWEASGDLFQLSLRDTNGDMDEIVANQLGDGRGSSYQPRAGRFYLQINALGTWNVRIVQIARETLVTPAKVGSKPEALTFQGKGVQTTRPFKVSGEWEVRWSATGDIFQVYLHSATSSREEVIANQLGSGVGSSYIPKGGIFYLQVNSVGSWKLEIGEVEE